MHNPSRERGHRSKTWIRRFDSPLEAIWPVLSDTARFNEAADLPRHQITETPRRDGSVEYVAQTHIGPIRITREEKPVNWVDRQWFEYCRRLLRPDRTYLRAACLEGQSTGGDVVTSPEFASD